MAIGGVTVVPNPGGSGMSNIQKPTNYIVADITERNALILSPSAKGSTAKVRDASADPTVESGWAVYSWDGESWTKTAEGESLEHGRECVKLSPDASAFGIGNVVGGYATRIDEVNEIGQTVTLISYDDDELLPEKFIVGEKAYIAHNPLNNLTVFTATIMNVAPVVENEVVTRIVLTLQPDPEEQDMPVIDGELPGILLVQDNDCDTTTQAEGQGNIVTGESAGANGSYNIIAGLCSHVFGVGNTAVGNMLKVFGISNNVQGVNLLVNGTSNNVDGMFTFVNGSQNKSRGDENDINGDMNDVKGDNITVNGSNNRVVTRTRIADDGSTITEKTRQAYVSGTLNEVNADYTHTCGYRLTNRAKHAIMFGRDTYLDDSPENEGAFIVGGGELNNPRDAFAVYSRRKIINPLYNPTNDPDGNGVDSSGEKQYIGQLGFLVKYLGHMLSTAKTQTVNNDSGTALNVSLDHDYYGRWKITPTGTGQITFTCDYWEDGDEGTLIIYNGNGKVSWPAEWTWIGSIPTLTTDGYDVFKLIAVDSDVIIKHEVSK